MVGGPALTPKPHLHQVGGGGADWLLDGSSGAQETHSLSSFTCHLRFYTYQPGLSSCFLHVDHPLSTHMVRRFIACDVACLLSFTALYRFTNQAQALETHVSGGGANSIAL